MNASLLLDERRVLSEDSFVALVVWRLPSPLAGSRHPFKYRLAFVVNGKCVIRYDNEAGKGDHKHLGEQETGYTFTTAKVLLEDFWKEVEQWRNTG